MRVLDSSWRRLARAVVSCLFQATLPIWFVFASAHAASAQPPAMRECDWNGLRAQCGILEVAENRSNPEGRRLRLPLMVIPASTRTAAATPLFMVAGGPGAGIALLRES